MKKAIRRIFVLLAVTAGVTACSSDDLSTSGVKEGLPVSLELSLSVPEAANVKMTRATDAQETVVEKVALVFYSKSSPSSTPVVFELSSSDLGTPTQVSTTNYKYTISLSQEATKDKGLYSGEWYFYGIGNYDKKYVSITLDQIKTMPKAQMDAYLTSGSSDQDIVETAVLMSGKYTTDANNGSGLLTLERGLNNLTAKPNSLLKLRRTIAKNIFKFKNGTGVTFTPTEYALYNYSTSATLMERSGWEGTNSTNPGSLTYSGAENSLKSKTDIPIKGSEFFFYTQENVQPCTATVSSYNLREQRKGTTDRTFKNAPANATYVVVKGTYSGPKSQTDNTQVTGEVEYTIHLGDFSSANSNAYDNFTVRRNCKYTYNVTINGVNSIIVEAMAENESDEFQHGAEGSITAKADGNSVRLDAHYEQVLLALDAQKFSAYELYINTPKTAAQTFKSSDLSNLSSADIEWVQFAQPATTSTFKSYKDAKTSGLCDIQTLLSELASANSASTTHALYDNGKYYVAAYVDEFYYDDLDLNKFVNVDDREMTLTQSTSVSPDGHSKYTESPIFSLKQRAIQCPFKLTLTNPFGLETVEETGVAAINSSSSDSYSGSDSNFGWSNFTTCGAFTLGTTKWSDIINEAYNGYIDGKIDESKIMKSGYDYSIFHCLSRNRDLDGDDVIDENEIRWYLPAHDQCLYIWFGNNSLPTETRLATSKHLYLTSTNGISRTWWADEGSAFGAYKSDDLYNGNKGVNAVCAVRSLGKNSYNLETSDVATYDESTKVVTISGLNENCLRSSKMTGNYAAHGTGDEADKLPSAIKLASKDFGTATASDVATSSTIGSTYAENNDAGYWRVPNEKELSLMLMFDKDNLTGGYYGSGRSGTTLVTSAAIAARTVYSGTRYYWMRGQEKASSPVSNITTNDAVKSYSNVKVRLVRDADQKTTSGDAKSGYSSTAADGGNAVSPTARRRR